MGEERKSRKRYRVVGVQPILGHPPGSEFEDDIAPDHEEFLISINGLKVIEQKQPEKPKTGWQLK